MKNLILLTALPLLMLSSCHKSGGSHTIPTVTTLPLSNITVSGVTFGGNITSDGGATVTDRGIMFDTGSTFSSARAIHLGTGTGSFPYTLDSLYQGTTYYVRAFATNSVGTGFGIAIKFTTDTLPSNYIVTTIAGNGTSAAVNGQALSASFLNPLGIAVDPAGVLYVAEANGQTTSDIRNIATNGAVTTFATLGKGVSDIVLDAAGNSYVVDQVTRLLYKITPGGTVTILAGSGGGFQQPVSLDIDSSTGNLYISDQQHIRKVTPAGNITTLPSTATSNYVGIAIDRSHNLYVSDGQVIDKIDSLGNVTTLVPATAGLGVIVELRIDRNGNLIAAGGQYSRITSISPSGVITPIAGTGLSADKDGSGSTAAFRSPVGLAIDAANNIYVADAGANKIKKITHK